MGAPPRTDAGCPSSSRNNCPLPLFRRAGRPNATRSPHLLGRGLAHWAIARGCRLLNPLTMKRVALRPKPMRTQLVRALRRSDTPGATAFREIRRLREENRKLKALVKDLLLDKTILEEVLRDA